MDFGGSSGATVHKIAGPAGMMGRLIEVGVCISEATVFATTLGQVEVGDSSDADEFAELNIATSVDNHATFNTADDTDAIIDATIPKDTTVLVTLTEGTGGGLAGKGFPYVIINWFK
jgi:dihydrodipicolinate reductase